MKVFFVLHSDRTAQKHTSGFAPLAGVPPVRQRLAACELAGGTPYPVQRTGSEFNQLALTRRGGLMRRAWERAASVGDAAAPRR